MSWQNKIILKLNLEDPSRRIVIDSSGLLRCEVFTNHLKNNGFEYEIALNFNSLFSASNSKAKLIFTANVEIPSFVKKNYAVNSFDLSDLPYNIDFEVLKNRNLSEIIVLLNYVSQINEHLSVNQKNIQTVLQQAINHSTKNRITEIQTQIDEILSLPAHYNRLLEMGILWGEWVYLCFKMGISPDLEIQNKIDNYSENYILSGKLKEIFYEQAEKLKSVDKIIGYLKPRIKNKTALICFDCMGVAEWFLLKDFLQSVEFQFHENYLFSLIPSITLFSRNAIFSGNYERVWLLNDNHTEEKSLSENFPNSEVKMFREKHTINSENLLGLDFVSIIYNFFDDLAHSTHFPARTEKNKDLYFKAISEYLHKSKIKETLVLLKNEGYTLYFCSDHGSVISEGIGKAEGKYLIDKASKRASYANKSLLTSALNYKQYEIPFVKDKIVLLAEGRTMFDTKGNVAITHGGISLEEIIVPFIEIKP